MDEITDPTDQKQMLTQLSYCVYPQDKSKITSILTSTVSLRTDMLRSGKSVKQFFPILVACPKLVSLYLIELL